MNDQDILKNIKLSSQVVGITWPLYAFVTSNPLVGFEHLKFEEACLLSYSNTGNLPYPDHSFFKYAQDKDLLSQSQMAEILKQHNYNGTSSDFFNTLTHLKQNPQPNSNHKVDQILVKWLSAFLDEGLADWQMPNKAQGFYKAWKSLAKYDKYIELSQHQKLPDTSIEVISELTKHLSEQEQLDCFKQHFLALPGWVGYLKYRRNNQTQWQDSFPLELEDYLAVRLLITQSLGIDILSKPTSPAKQKQLLGILQNCLSKVEHAWQIKMASQLHLEASTATKKSRPEAQLVFCIDTRSALIRRHIESKGAFQTYGYAGFFGIAMDYETPFSKLKRKSCPPILDSAYKVKEQHKKQNTEKFADLTSNYKKLSFKNYFLTRMKNILPSAFGFVEGAGLAYAYKLLERTFKMPKTEAVSNEVSVENLCDTQISNASNGKEISLEEQSQIVKSAFDLMGWEDFAPLVIFAGHGSHTANNPFASSLDCGACAASPGRHNARMIAQLANSKKVRSHLKETSGINIPNDTLFLGAEHNTTTDEIILFDANVPDAFKPKIQRLKTQLRKAQISATAERLGKTKSLEKAYKKSTNWSETRPEWGLAKNAGFIIGSRELTKDRNLEGQCFLHSYNWETDKEGTALNAILNGPMVVTQWINNHYYFSSVDNANYGSGSKITQNVVGKFGVVQGNGGDLKTGLPLQSLKMTDEDNYHQPQRLSVFVHAPKDLLHKLISQNEKIKSLLDNQWIHLLVVDPLKGNTIEKYQANLSWTKLTDETSKTGVPA